MRSHIMSSVSFKTANASLIFHSRFTNCKAEEIVWSCFIDVSDELSSQH